MTRLLPYVGRRLLLALPVLFGVSVVSFMLIHLAPGNVAAYDAPVRASIRLGQWERAERMLSAGLAATRAVPLRVLRAELFLAQDRRVEARLELDSVLAQDPGNAEAIALRTRLEAQR